MNTPKCCLTCMFDHHECNPSNHQSCGRVNGKTHALDMLGAERRVMNWIKDLNADDDAIILRAAEIIKRRIGKSNFYTAMYGGYVPEVRKDPAITAFIYGEPPIHSYEDLDDKYRENYEMKVPPGGEALKHTEEPVTLKVTQPKTGSSCSKKLYYLDCKAYAKNGTCDVCQNNTVEIAKAKPVQEGLVQDFEVETTK